MRKIDNVIYNKESITKWTEEVLTLPALVTEKKGVLSQLEAERKKLATTARELSSTSALLKGQAAQLRGRHYEGTEGIFNVIMDGDARLGLQNSAQNIDSAVRAVKREIDAKDEEINKVKGEIETAEVRIKYCNKHISEGTNFLSKLMSEPDKLFKDLKTKILIDFDDYNLNYPVSMSFQARSCLFNIELKLKALSPQATLENKALYQEQYLQLYRERYLLLCAFLWDMYSKVENKDEHFADCLIGIINTTHILEKEEPTETNKLEPNLSIKGDLPDEMQTKLNVVEFIETIKSNKALLKDISETDLTIKERDAYHSALNLMNRKVNPEINIKLKERPDAILKARALIENEVTSKLANKEEVDYHFYAFVLRNLNDKLDPNDPGAGTGASLRLVRLAEHATGAPSLSKKLVGTLVALAGLLIIGLSVAGLLTSCGGSSLGIIFGLALIKANTALFVTLFSSSLMGGVGLTLFGCKTGVNGMRHGLSKALISVDTGQNSRETQPKNDELVSSPA